MIDNSRDQGRIMIQLREKRDGLYLSELTGDKGEDGFYFFVDYADGRIYVDWDDGSEPRVVGFYDTPGEGEARCAVWNGSRSHIIGRVGGGAIRFCKQSAAAAAPRFAGERCLAFYREDGNITALRGAPVVGIIHGGEIGGAAAFAAVFVRYRIRSVYRDYFEMGTDIFEQVHHRYLHPLEP